MGTRNLVAVQLDGQYKVAQYGQWDGYPEGQGMGCLEFLRKEMEEDVFKSALRNTSFISSKELAELWQQYGASSEGWVTMEQADNMKRDHPEFSRDTGSDILKLVQDHPEGMKLQNSIDFIGDGLFCEWAWVIDLDKRTFEGFRGFNQTPLTPGERFYGFDGDGDYQPPHLTACFSIDELPDDKTFLAAFDEDEEGEDAEDQD